MMSYVGLKGPSSPQDALFACPADTFNYTDADASSYTSGGIHELAVYNYSSYLFNAGNIRRSTVTNVFPGIAGRRLTSIINPSKTVLVDEGSATAPYSWHQPTRLPSARREFTTRKAWSASRMAMSAISKSILTQTPHLSISKPGNMTRRKTTITNGAEIKHEHCHCHSVILPRCNYICRSTSN